MAETVRARVRVSGRVQGVFFRAETRETARRLALSGWVRNVEDGTVEAVFEGDLAAVEEAVMWARHGPADARVEALDLSWEEPSGEGGFQVRYGR